jgi:hypothetical protein
LSCGDLNGLGFGPEGGTAAGELAFELIGGGFEAGQFGLILGGGELGRGNEGGGGEGYCGVLAL